MKPRFLLASIGATLLLVPLVSAQTSKKPAAMTNDMRQAIAFEHHKDLAAARQARLEARHPSVTNNRDRSADRSAEPENGRPVRDPGPPPKKDH